MFILFVLAVMFAAVLLAGGRLSALGTLRLRQTWLLALSLGLQILVTEATARTLHGAPDASLHVVSYLIAGVFLWRNRNVPGLWLIGAGALLNGAVIALNGGELPASARALRAAHIHQKAGAFANSGHLAHPVLSWLGDVVATPSWLPFQNVMSVGDVLILIGAGVLLVRTCGHRWQRARADVTASDTAPEPVLLAS